MRSAAHTGSVWQGTNSACHCILQVAGWGTPCLQWGCDIEWVQPNRCPIQLSLRPEESQFSRWLLGVTLPGVTLPIHTEYV